MLWPIIIMEWFLFVESNDRAKRLPVACVEWQVKNKWKYHNLEQMMTMACTELNPMRFGLFNNSQLICFLHHHSHENISPGRYFVYEKLRNRNNRPRMLFNMAGNAVWWNTVNTDDDGDSARPNENHYFYWHQHYYWCFLHLFLCTDCAFSRPTTERNYKYSIEIFVCGCVVILLFILFILRYVFFYETSVVRTQTLCIQF